MKGHLLRHDHSCSFRERLGNLVNGEIDPLWPDIPRDDFTSKRFVGPQALPFKPLEPPSSMVWGVDALSTLGYSWD
jgi:hypothetical protein